MVCKICVVIILELFNLPILKPHKASYGDNNVPREVGRRASANPKEFFQYNLLDKLSVSFEVQ